MASRLGLGPAAAAKSSSAPRKAGERVGQLRPLRVQRLERLGRRRPPLAVLDAQRHGRPQRLRVLAATLRARPRPSSGSAVASCCSIAGRSMTSPHQAAKGPSHCTSSTSPRAVPRVVSTSRQKSALSAPCSGARQLARAVGEPLELAKPQARVVRRRPAPGPEVGALAARVEGVAAEADREDLERETGVGIAPSGLAPLRERDRGSPPARARSSSTSPRGWALRQAPRAGAWRAGGPRDAARTRARTPRAR